MTWPKRSYTGTPTQRSPSSCSSRSSLNPCSRTSASSVPSPWRAETRLIADDQPTIEQALIEQRDSGKAVLLVSLELDEILDLSDRIAVIHNGALIGIVDAAATDEKEIGLMMAGCRKDTASEKTQPGKERAA